MGCCAKLPGELSLGFEFCDEDVFEVFLHLCISLSKSDFILSLSVRSLPFFLLMEPVEDDDSKEVEGDDDEQVQ